MSWKSVRETVITVSLIVFFLSGLGYLISFCSPLVIGVIIAGLVLSAVIIAGIVFSLACMTKVPQPRQPLPDLTPDYVRRADKMKRRGA